MIQWKAGSTTARETLAALVPLAPWYVKPRLAELLEKLTERGIEIKVQKARKHHTTPQQHYYWFCIGLFAKHYGTTPDDMHNVILMEAFGQTEVDVSDDRWFYVPKKRSSGLSVEEYGELIETLHRCAAFNGCALPDPETVGE
jgi:hypothetical protein